MTLEEYDDEYCPQCHAMLELESCWSCMGNGGFHNCGEDTCVCLDKETLQDVCEECDGEGAYLVCPNAKHHPSAEEDPDA